MSDDLLRFASQLEAGLTDEVKAGLMQRVVVVTERHIYNEMPEKTGQLKAKIRADHSAKGGQIEFYADYAVFAHEPTRPHIIRGNPTLAFNVGGVTVFAHSVKHPGTKGNPFIDRGLDKAASDIDAALLAAAEQVIGGAL